MSVDTVWLETKAAVSGLDQLGIRATAIRMYAHLIPSITNVTDRARYFSLHPYAIDSWAREVGTDDPVAFRQFLRRLECLLAIGERVRVYGSEEESYGVVGRIKIGRWLNKQPDPRDHDYAVPLDRLQEEYFANSWGSLGQYYGGPEAELGIIAWDEGFPKLTPLGQQLAAAFSTGVQQSHLSAVLRCRSLASPISGRSDRKFGLIALHPQRYISFATFSLTSAITMERQDFAGGKVVCSCYPLHGKWQGQWKTWPRP
jgi:hypothetical protein